MKSSITKGLEEDQAQEMKEHFVRARPVRSRLTELLNEKMNEEYVRMRSKKVFDTPSWSNKQAYSLGYCNAISELIELLSEK